MLKKILLSIFLAGCFMAAAAQPFDCSKFREGRYRIADANAGGITIIERKGNYQTESNEGLKLIIGLTLRWIDNCSYELKFDKILRNDNKIDIPKMTMLVKITETRENGYTQETTSSSYNGVYRSEVTRIW